MRTIVFLLTAFLLVTSSSCQKDPASSPKEPKTIHLPAKGSQIISQSNEFGIELFRHVAPAEQGNMMLSPLSASTALTMLLNGCKESTYEQIKDMLGYEGMTLAEINTAYEVLTRELLSADPEVIISLANSVWYRQQFQVKQPFLDTMHKAFTARIEALDFDAPPAVTTINNWAKDNTNGKIDKVISSISDEMVMFLVNALYFKGLWTYPFDPQYTTTMPFHPDHGSTSDVDMMQAMIFARTMQGTCYQALELPYGRQNFSMMIIVPEVTVDEFLADFDVNTWNTITAAIDSIQSPTDIQVILPKFKFRYEKELNNPLAELGMTDAFIPYVADLSGISDDELYVSFVKQNTFIEVNEEGTEAAAVTTIGVGIVSLPPTFIADKSFIFTIRERTTGTLLFIGKVNNPE